VVSIENQQQKKDAECHVALAEMVGRRSCLMMWFWRLHSKWLMSRKVTGAAHIESLHYRMILPMKSPRSSTI